MYSIEVYLDSYVTTLCDSARARNTFEESNSFPFSDNKVQGMVAPRTLDRTSVGLPKLLNQCPIGASLATGGALSILSRSEPIATEKCIAPWAYQLFTCCRGGIYLACAIV